MYSETLTQHDGWLYYVWECVTTHPTMRPLGRKQTDGCGHWNLRKSKTKITSSSTQSKCTSCGRRKRLNPANLNIRVLLDRDTAKATLNALNEEE